MEFELNMRGENHFFKLVKREEKGEEDSMDIRYKLKAELKEKKSFCPKNGLSRFYS